MLWEALMQAHRGEYESAEKLYLQLLEAPGADNYARAVALVNLIHVRHAKGNWQGLIESVELFNQLYGDATAPFGNRRETQWFINAARRQLAAEASE
jgi:hypothetical protein